MSEELSRDLRTREELIYCTAVSKLMVLATVKRQMNLVQHLYASVIEVYEFEGVFTLFYTLVMASRMSRQKVMPPGPDAPAGDHLGWQLTQHIAANDFQQAWDLFEREYINLAEPSDEIHIGTLEYLINTVACVAMNFAIEQVLGPSEQE